MEILDYYYMFLRRKWVFGLAFVSCILIMLIWLVNATPIFKAEAKLLFHGSAIASIMNISSTDATADISTQMELIKTRPIAKAVVHKLKLVDEAGNFWDEGGLAGGVIVEAVRGTSIFMLAYRHKNRKLVTDIVNAFAQVVVEQNREVNREEYQLAIRFIETQIEKRRDGFERSQQKLLDFLKREDSVAVSKETEILVARLVSFTTTEVDLASEIEVANAKMVALNKKIIQMSNINAPFISQWKNEVNQLNIGLTGLNARKTFLQNEILEIKNEISKLPPKELLYAQLVSESNFENKLLNNLLIKLEETKIFEAAKIASIRIV
ncbi:hypothetical protein HN928_06950, partial [bacterium]|nr:hypothetical protein [bacterium]